MSEQQNYELIQKYLAQQLSEDEAKAFETRAQTDPEFAEEVILHTLARKEMEAAVEADLRERLRGNFDKAREANVISMQSTRRQWFSIAAVIILLIASIPLIRLILQPGYIESNDIYADHFEAPVLKALGTRGQGDENEDEKWSTYQDIWNQAILAINQKEFGQAIQHLEALEKDSDFMAKFNSTIHYQLGVVWLLNEDPQKAITYFDQVDNESVRSGDAHWFKGMAYLKLDRRSEALQTFSQAVNDPKQVPARQEKAKEIIEKLEGK